MTNISDQKANSDKANAKAADDKTMDAKPMNAPAGAKPAESKAADTKTADAKSTLTQDIHGKWDKFSEGEVAALTSNDDLISQVETKYSLSAAQAKTDVMALLAGRHI
jgi:hypothetical protein